MRINKAALQTIRLRSGLNKSQLATRAGVSTGTLNDLESGRRGGSPELIKKVAVALDVPVLALITDPDSWTEAHR